jgi:hypothetical protein
MPLLLLLPLSGGPTRLRLCLVSAHGYTDVDAHTPAQGYLTPGWDAGSGPGSHLLVPLTFSPLPLHFLLSLLRLNTINTRRFCRRRGPLSRSGRDACDRPCMLGVQEGRRRGGVPRLLRALGRELPFWPLPVGSCRRWRGWRCRRARRRRR